MGLFKRKSVTQIKVIHSTSMRLEQWKSSQELVGYAQRLFATPEFQTLLGVLRNECPSNFGLSGGTHDDHIAHAYRGEGYNLALNNLESLAALEKSKPQIEATFAPEAPIQIVQ